MVKIGYYPGDPIPRPPKRGGAGKYVPSTFGETDLESWVDQFEMDVSHVPDTVRDWVVGDVKRSLIASGNIDPTFDVNTALLYGDLDQVPGTQLKVNLNPADWAKDPKKEATNMLKNWGNSIINWHDLYDYVEKEYFYEPILAGRDKWAPPGEDLSNLFGVDSVAQSLVGYNDPNWGGLKPFQLFESGIERNAVWETERDILIDPVTGQAIVDPTRGTIVRDTKTGQDVTVTSKMGKLDVGTEAAEAKIKFHGKVESAPARNAQFNIVRKKYGNAVKEELSQRYGDHAQGRLAGISATAALTPEQKEQLLAFHALMDISDGVEGLSRGPLGKTGLTGMSKGLYQLHAEGENALNSLNDQVTIKHLWEDSGLDNPFVGFFSAIDRGRNLLSSNPGALAAYNKEVAPFEAIAAEARGIVDGIQHLDVNNPFHRQQLANAGGRLAKLNDRISQPGFLGKGLESRVADKIELFLNGGPAPFVGGNSKDLLNQSMIDARNGVGHNKSLIRNVQINLRDDRNSYNYNDVKGFTGLVEKGDLGEQYLYNRFKRRIEPFTPAYHAKKILTKVHYFGLVYDQDIVDEKARKNTALWQWDAATGSRRIDPLTGKDMAAKEGFLGNLTGDRSSYDRIARLMPKNKITIYGGNGKVVVEGGRHLLAAEGMNKMFKSVQDRTDPAHHLGKLGALLNPKTGALIGFDPSSDHLIRFINAKSLTDLSGFGLVLDFEKTDLLDLHLARVRNFREWLHANRDRFGLRFDANGLLIKDAANMGAMSNIMVSLSSKISVPHSIPITWERVGWLQKLTVQTNKIQSALMKKVAPFVAPYVKAKKAIVSAITQMIIQAGAAASGGLGELLQFIKPVIDKIVVFVLQKVENLVRTVASGLIKREMTIEPFIKGLEKTNSAITKAAISLLLVPLGLLFVVFTLFTVVMTTISPLDPTRTGSLMGSTFGGVPGAGLPVDCANPNDGDLASLGGGSWIPGRAYDIALGLQPGFWCFWNRHPDYPQFWNQAMFDQNPNPGDISCWDCLFWCTYLVIESYNDSGVSLPRDLINSQNMAIHFGYNPDAPMNSDITPPWKYISNLGTGVINYGIRPGDVIFFKTPSRAYYRLAHVAIVHSVTEDYIETIHSNSSSKRWPFTRTSSGRVQDDYSFFEVYGFGRYEP